MKFAVIGRGGDAAATASCMVFRNQAAGRGRPGALLIERILIFHVQPTFNATELA
jgi:hypothetical protein